MDATSTLALYTLFHSTRRTSTSSMSSISTLSSLSSCGSESNPETSINPETTLATLRFQLAMQILEAQAKVCVSADGRKQVLPDVLNYLWSWTIFNTMIQSGFAETFESIQLPLSLHHANRR